MNPLVLVCATLGAVAALALIAVAVVDVKAGTYMEIYRIVHERN